VGAGVAVAAGVGVEAGAGVWVGDDVQLAIVATSIKAAIDAAKIFLKSGIWFFPPWCLGKRFIKTFELKNILPMFLKRSVRIMIIGKENVNKKRSVCKGRKIY